jgi:hypothetical protein
MARRENSARAFAFDRVCSMLAMLQDLVQHKGYANAVLLKAVRQHEKATQDQELRELLHHIILANALRPKRWFTPPKCVLIGPWI